MSALQEIARNEQFLLFPLCFLHFLRIYCHFHQTWNCRLQTVSVWKSLKFVVWKRVTSNDQIPDLTRIRVHPDTKSYVDLMMKFLFERAENIVRKAESAANQHILLFHQCFQKPLTLYCTTNFLKSPISKYLQMKNLTKNMTYAFNHVENIAGK